MADAEDRTLAATERRRQQARAEGQAPLSREVVAASGMAAAALLLAVAAPGGALGLGRQLQAMLANPRATPGAALWDAGSALLGCVLPVGLTILVAGSLAVLLQTGWLLHGKALLPDPARLDPRRGLKRLFGVGNAVEAGKALAKVGVLGWAIWRAMADTFPSTAASLSWTTATLLDRIARDGLRVLLVVLGCQCLIAVLDVAWVRFRFARQLRMSLEDVKQEQKETDGDPRHKAKLRQIRMTRTRRRMLAAVAKATVVITNPTHYAVALAYQRGSQAAPKVVAKGVDEVAARIREMAEKNGVPLVANPPLARTLHTLPLDAEVPAEHFKAVAEIIAYVLRLRGRTDT